MKPFNLTVGNSLKVTVLPDSEAHMDGHPVLTYSYRLYNNKSLSADDIGEKESKLHLENDSDPNFMGVILFEAPDRLFTYEPGHQQLSRDQLEELIEQITHYRDSPAKWLI